MKITINTNNSLINDITYISELRNLALETNHLKDIEAINTMCDTKRHHEHRTNGSIAIYDNDGNKSTVELEINDDMIIDYLRVYAKFITPMWNAYQGAKSLVNMIVDSTTGTIHRVKSEIKELGKKWSNSAVMFQIIKVIIGDEYQYVIAGFDKFDQCQRITRISDTKYRSIEDYPEYQKKMFDVIADEILNRNADNSTEGIDCATMLSVAVSEEEATSIVEKLRHKDDEIA